MAFNAVKVWANQYIYLYVCVCACVCVCVRERERERESSQAVYYNATERKWSRIRFGLVSLFNGISTFVGYLMPKSSF